MDCHALRARNDDYAKAHYRVASLPSTVIAKSKATWQSILRTRIKPPVPWIATPCGLVMTAMPKPITVSVTLLHRHCEEQSDVAIHRLPSTADR